MILITLLCFNCSEAPLEIPLDSNRNVNFNVNMSNFYSQNDSIKLHIDNNELAAEKIVKVWESISNESHSKPNNWIKFYWLIKIINLKIKSALKKKLKIIFCIGETLKEKRKNKTNLVLKSQIVHGLKNIKKNNNIIFAYEPVWSIGTGLIPKNNDLKEQINVIKKTISKFCRLNNPKIIYGGSVNPKNISELRKISSIKGFLIGGASQKAKNFIDIIKKTIN